VSIAFSLQWLLKEIRNSFKTLLLVCLHIRLPSRQKPVQSLALFCWLWEGFCQTIILYFQKVCLLGWWIKIMNFVFPLKEYEYYVAKCRSRSLNSGRQPLWHLWGLIYSLKACKNLTFNENLFSILLILNRFLSTVLWAKTCPKSMSMSEVSVEKTLLKVGK